MEKTDAFAYCFDEEQIRSVLPKWPVGIGLLLCLKADGTCQSLVFHVDEGPRALRRAAEVLDLAPRTFAIAPEVKGWPTRPVRFSEEQDLLTLAVAPKNLVELAISYVASFQAEQAEAAQTAVEFTSQRARPKSSRRLNLRLGPSDFAAPHGETNQIHTAPVLDRDEPAVTPRDEMPPGFVDGGTARECYFDSGQIMALSDRIRVTLAPGKVRINVLPDLVADIGFSADFSRFYLPRAVLRNWQPGQPAVIDIPLQIFPENWRVAFEKWTFTVDAAITPQGIFLTPQMQPNPPVLSETTTAPAPAEPPKRRWRLPVRAAAASLFAASAVGAAAAIAVMPDKPVQLPFVQDTRAAE